MSCLRYCLFLFSLFYIFILNVTSAKYIFSFNVKIFDLKWDLATKKELYKYLGAVEDIVVYCEGHKDEIDISLAFSLFLTNVNLGHALQRKAGSIPKNVKSRIKNVIHKNNKVLNVFKKFVNQENEGHSEKILIERDVLSLFTNASYWIEKINKFMYTVEKQYTSDEFTEIYSPFSLYLKKVDEHYNWDPDPDSSDRCLASLSENPINMGCSSPRCLITDFCYDMVKGGTNFGYALTHRLVLLLLARFGRRCTVFSQHEDRALIKQFCSMAHAEAEYIAENNFGHSDLFMEIISLCTLDGHSQFLYRVWLDNMLTFQTPDGCFGTTPVMKVKGIRGSRFRTKVAKRDNIQQNECTVHTTGVAITAFSAAVRFILEEYY